MIAAMSNDSEQKLKPTVPLTEAGYLRSFEAEIDVIAENELLVRGRMSDHRFTLGHVWALRTPEYEVVRAGAHQSAGDENEFSPELCARYSEIKGVRIGRGFSKRILTALGGLPGTQEHLFLAIEMARVGQQVYQFPPDFERQFPGRPGSLTEAAHIAWRKDRAYMPDLANSCYTYRDESAELFRHREVRCGFDAELTRPRPGQKAAFWRRKRVSIREGSAGDGRSAYVCESAMEDNIHDILVGFEIAGDGTISGAHSRGLRLPYHGICEDAQQRTPGLNGLSVTTDYVRQFAEYVGGSSGCTHLFDLSIDCLRLFRFSE
ncbi:MAG TPA: DUF2889 domain-containing protein [Blastocatellia bacterium]|nr:DUF2889 domain-containing protein [Blastocatellia bacterium]